MRRWPQRLGWLLLVVVALFAVATFVTARSGNSRLYPATEGARRIEVFVVSHGYHAGLVLPRALVADLAGQDSHAALMAVSSRFGLYRSLEIGWGDEGFYTSVPAMTSLTVSSAARALFRLGNPSVLHVVGLADHPRAMFPHADMVRLELSEPGFRRLLNRLDASFAPGQQDLGPGLYGPSLFYRAVGTFHLLNVCNHWVADLLDTAGVPTTPLPATLPAGLLLDLEWRAGARRVPSALAR